MKVNFNSIEITGFRSIVKPLMFNLNKPGLNLIKGLNGAGKTSIFEALAWGLYGINLKDTNLAQVASWLEVRGSQWLGTKVEIRFTVDQVSYCISRHLGYKGLTYDVKGEDYLMLAKGDGERQLSQINDYRNKDLTQQAITQLLGVDSRTFLNSVLFGQRMQKLITQDNKDKRELFEVLFATEWVANCKLKCDADITQWNTDLAKISYDINTSLTSIEHLTDKLSTAKETLAGFEASRTVRYTAAVEDLNTHKKTLGEFEAEIVLYKEAQDAIKYDAEAHVKLEDQFTELEKQLNATEFAQVNHTHKLTTAQNLVLTKKSEATRTGLELKKLVDKHIEGDCPYCEQELKAGNKLEVNHNAEITEVTRKVDTAELALKEAETALKALQKVKAPATPESITKEKEAIEEQLVAMDQLLGAYNAQVENIKEATIDKTQAEKDIIRITKTVGDIKAEKPPVVDLKGIEASILNEQNKQKTAQQDKLKIEKKIEIAKWWSSKGFGAGGIKAYIFTSMLSQLNQNVKKYGDRLGASLEFSIDLTKASKPFTTICSIGDKLNKDYKEFSGGQKQKLDIALLFAMQDLISMNTDMNILIMDEVFEGLSEDGETAVFDLIRGKAEEGRSVYVITHSAVLDSLYANTIEFELINGNTVIVN